MSPSADTAAGEGHPVTVVTQTRAKDDKAAAFSAWQKTISEVVSRRPGFIKQTVIPPSPPVQLDWVILQRFTDRDSALAWLNSADRKRLVAEAGDMLVGQDDVHLLRDDTQAVAAPVSAVISTRIKAGQEDAYRRWEQKIAALQAQAPGFQGYRFEEPVPGVQDDWLAILRFDSEEHLQAWFDSPDRKKLVDESTGFTDEYHTRIVRTGFDQWFQMGGGQGNGPAAWKQNMLVLMLLYPVVFVFGLLVSRPLLDMELHLPFWLTLFIGNIASVLLLSWLVPWVSRRFGWWLQPDAHHARRTNVLGAGLVVAIYAISLAVFSQL
jgi:antibiotic biosynthesis monooxygenase (ABM) superfamily enzyme